MPDGDIGTTARVIGETHLESLVSTIIRQFQCGNRIERLGVIRIGHHAHLQGGGNITHRCGGKHQFVAAHRVLGIHGNLGQHDDIDIAKRRGVETQGTITQKGIIMCYTRIIFAVGIVRPAWRENAIHHILETGAVRQAREGYTCCGKPGLHPVAVDAFATGGSHADIITIRGFKSLQRKGIGDRAFHCNVLAFVRLAVLQFPSGIVVDDVGPAQRGGVGGDIARLQVGGDVAIVITLVEIAEGDLGQERLRTIIVVPAIVIGRAKALGVLRSHTQPIDIVGVHGTRWI